MAERFANIRFGLNDKGEQVKTPGQHVPMRLMDNDRDARMDSVPGRRTIPQQKSSDPQSPREDPVRPVQPEDSQDVNDVDVVIKLSALKKLKAAAGQR